jgi:hypothetical protein
LSRDYYDDCCWFYKKESDHVEKKINEKHNENSMPLNSPRSTPIIDANGYHSGKSNKFKYNESDVK